MATQCDCGAVAIYHPLIGLQIENLCAECYGNEFPEKAATFDLARTAPNAPELRELGPAPCQGESVQSGWDDFISRHGFPDSLRG